MESEKKLGCFDISVGDLSNDLQVTALHLGNGCSTQIGGAEEKTAMVLTAIV